MKRTAVISALLLAGCFWSYDKDTGTPRVRRGTFINQAILTGELEAARGATVSVPPLPNWQTSIKWLAPDGADVKAGDRVVELDNTSIATDLDQKTQTKAQSLEELEQKNAEWVADLRDKQLDVERKKSDLEKAKIEANVPKEIVSARDFEDRQNKLRKAQTEFDKSQETLRAQEKAVASDRANLQVKIERAQREVDTSNRALDQMVLRAPRDGIVVVKDHPWEPRKLQNGDTVWVGFAIALMPELDSLQVAASLPDVDDGRVAVGMPASITIDGYPGMHFPGVVQSISAVAQEEVRNSMRRRFRVVIRIDRIDRALMRPGLSARVQIRREMLRDVLLAPRAAIDFTSKEPRARLASGKLVK